MYLSYLRKLAFTFCLPLLLPLAACDKFEYSPNETNLEEEEKHLTKKNIAEIQALNLDKKTSFRFAVISDTQRFYDELDAAVDALNQRTDIDFIVLTGDITDFGITKEFRWINERMQKLNMPFLTVIGNHDCQGNGKRIYKAMYGPVDYKLDIGQNRFVFMNTNSLEFTDPVPDLNTFKSLLQDTANFKQAFVFSHIAPYDVDFDRSLEPGFVRIARESKVKISFHGHRHNYEEPKKHYEGNVDYIIIGSVQKRGYEEVTITGTKVEMKRIPF